VLLLSRLSVDMPQYIKRKENRRGKTQAGNAIMEGRSMEHKKVYTKSIHTEP
jgi:hypothetical protein